MKVYFHISGRLGNQLFQWAYVHELINRGYEVELFVDRYHNDPNVIELNRLLSNCSHLHMAKMNNGLGQVLRLKEKLLTLGGVGIWASRVLPVHIESIPKQKKINIVPQIVDGYFIDKIWVEKNSSILLPELEKTLLSIPSRPELEELVNSAITTRVHIRRGDLNLFKSTFGLLSEEYYKRAIQQNESCMVLTDSPEEAQKVLQEFHKAIIVNPLDFEVWEALLILSKSKKFIMSNSTLGWWAGFLALKLNTAEIYMPKPFYTQASKFDNQLTLAEFHAVESSFE